MSAFVDGAVAVLFNQGTTDSEAEQVFQSLGISEEKFMQVFCGAPFYLVSVPSGDEERWAGRFIECRWVGSAARVLSCQGS